MYSSKLLDHFQHPRNAGELPDADIRVEVENPACGDILRLAVKVADGRISEIRFKAKGCVPAMACASALTELVRGKTLAETRALSRDDVIQAVGGVPEASTHAGHLAIEALTAVLRKLQK
jgi:nitrogen fixation NifU-like protein